MVKNIPGGSRLCGVQIWAPLSPDCVFLSNELNLFKFHFHHVSVGLFLAPSSQTQMGLCLGKEDNAEELL